MSEFFSKYNIGDIINFSHSGDGTGKVEALEVCDIAVIRILTHPRYPKGNAIKLAKTYLGDKVSENLLD
jgi:hypothetical protein